jgi:hypothetical protein
VTNPDKAELDLLHDQVRFINERGAEDMKILAESIPVLWEKDTKDVALKRIAQRVLDLECRIAQLESDRG